MNSEQFRRVKQAMLNIFNILDEMEKSGAPSEQLQAEVEQMVQEYYRLQAQLLDSDLSSIPFEEWEGLTLMSEGELDFSKTYLNQTFQFSKSRRWGVIDARYGSSLDYTFTSAECETIDKLIVKESLKYTNTFNYCIGLKNITIEGVIGETINFAYCPLTKQSIESVVSHLSTSASGKVLSLSTSAVKKAFETSAGANDGTTSAEWLALIATRSNWTIGLS
jgi:hypothetical protein